MGCKSVEGQPWSPLGHSREGVMWCGGPRHFWHSGGSPDEIWVHVTVNANFMEGMLLVVSTGFVPGSIFCLTLFVHGYFAVCAS